MGCSFLNRVGAAPWTIVVVTFILRSADATLTIWYEWLIERIFAFTNLAIVRPIESLLSESTPFTRTVFPLCGCACVFSTLRLLSRICTSYPCWVPVLQLLPSHCWRYHVGVGFISFHFVRVAFGPCALVHEPLDSRHCPFHLVVCPTVCKMLGDVRDVVPLILKCW